MPQSVFWYAKTVEEVMRLQQTQKEGLTEDEVRKRREQDGLNALPKEKPLQWWILFFRQFGSPMIYVLLGASIITILLQEWTDTAIILGAIFLNTIIGFIQELKANRALEHLRALVQPKALVRRAGEELQIAADALVVGDILILQTGDRVTADARLIQSVDLQINEAVLTGESQPVKKQTRPVSESSVLAERKDMVYAGTSVVGGKGVAVVVETGIRTQIGQIAKLVSESEEVATPLQQQLVVLAKHIAVIISLLIVVLFVLGPFLGYRIVDMLKISVALAVAAIPEGLVISVTIILAIGMHRILLRRSLVRRLVGAETLGSVSVICTDKTGTLTEGEMRATHLITIDQTYELSHAKNVPSHPTAQRLMNALVLCNNAERVSDGINPVLRGSPTDRALLRFAIELGIDVDAVVRETPRYSEIPFDSSFKYLATAHRNQKSAFVILSGAPDRLVKFCSFIEERGERKEFSQTRQKQVFAQMERHASEGIRLVAFVRKEIKQKESELSREMLEDFVWLGMVGLSDPVREQARVQIAQAKAAGVRTIMATGDHPSTARAIALQVGLEVNAGSVVTGEEMDGWSDQELERRISRVSVFARVEPKHKIRIIKAWQSRGDVVAMVGDGVNDTPALKAADIGVAVGSGTEAAKHVADLVLLDNDLGTITSAIEQGRVIFDNIRKTTVYLISGSFTEIILIAGTMLFGLPLPLLPAQILWINLVADTFPNIGLTLEPGEKDVMKLTPRPRTEPVLNKEMRRLMFSIGTVVIISLVVFYLYLLGRFDDVSRIRTYMFAAVALDTLIYVFAIKSLRHSIFRMNPLSNPWLLLSVCVSFGLMLLAFMLPILQQIFEVTPLGLSEWLLLLMISTIKLFVIELIKELIHLKQRRYQPI